MSSQLKQFEYGCQLRDYLLVLFVEKQDMDDVKESIMEAEWHLGILHADVGCISLQFVYDSSDRLKLLFCVWP